MKNLKKLSKELLNNELIDMYKSNKSTVLKKELINRAKKQQPFIYSNNKPANLKLIEFVKTINN